MSKFIDWLRARCASKRGPLAVLAVGVLVGFGIIGSTSAVLVMTSTEEFCASACHEMSYNYDEYKGSIHDINRGGVRATCVDCHLPSTGMPLYFRKINAARDLWGHFVTGSLNTPEKFEAKRYEMAVRVWKYMKESDSRECKACHTMESIDQEKATEKSKRRHQKGKDENMACIDCHYAIAHKEPEGGPGPQELDFK
ncbi:MAG: NapC/NirT family cytochrome c [Rhodocyclaceae bacterium]|nr:NapC/NirT family cytochrome c [Rhodocyclaceae bacterium]MDZ4215533.1 NapC/NirT family cytochrome c [Rhodocyclaceae bacterium]